MTTINTGNTTTIVLTGVAEAQVVYNALHEYYRNYKGENENHRQLAENMADNYHDEYIKDVVLSEDDKNML